MVQPAPRGPLPSTTQEVPASSTQIMWRNPGSDEIAQDYDLRLVITGGVEAYKLADELAAADEESFSATPVASLRHPWRRRRWSIEGPAILSQAGVKVAFFGPGASRRASPIGRLVGTNPKFPAWAFRNGVPEVEAYGWQP
ncbi:MAG: hypothetical protein Ct9H300mP15_22960 [Gemmatimonadota bacterium]|nr:MAG: hypothetical protein Ct9H300mP15_22960 [Gemmatimonadota bacterium]